MSNKKKRLTISGLVDSGVIKTAQDDIPKAILPQFKARNDTINLDPNVADVKNINVDLIEPNPFQPRRHFPETSLSELAHSIAETGLLQPISVRRSRKEGWYEIIAGERRWRAYKQLAMAAIPAIIYACDDADMAIMAITENVEREELSDYEISKAIKQVESLFPYKTRLAEALGFQREDMYRYFAYDALPDFIIEKLEINPVLLSRNTASDIKRLLKSIPEAQQDVALNALKEAIAMVEKKDLDQSKIARYVATMVSKPISLQTNQLHFRLKGKKIGYYSSSANGITLKLSAGVFDDAELNQLQTIINTMLADKEQQEAS
ncbi:ParB/RepB/Spo0J family partition protein [Methylovulum psychrotolerans]|uniref:ParB/RepB/Spo0J family partition protein n=1 Tax=Methylovulum psychrotolerans TaxID=1704499 RepID=UPI001BFF8BF8|nr:ParB/RepB/Spo0J family partition protein [Methylovulum psychrotolerans]MBT9099792.1 ParB/RepB/Spo0J family partition protein [Methylovulum psychrotolerans]